jgi:cellulose synthase/poly-beta-1,6-N-acetylglucosamine synthase-like glycosyltransferase
MSELDENYVIHIFIMFSGSGHIWAVIHFTALSGLALYGIHRLWFLFCRHGKSKTGVSVSAGALCFCERGFPFITVQLPLYNERFVAGRLIDAVAQLEWPKDKLEVQILDDSVDDTGDIVDARISRWRQEGIDIKALRRGHREGYKAGALNHGLVQAKGEFIAIFDADFLPPGEFLLRTVPCFSDRQVGMVQARWGFLNSEHSWLTGIQSLLLGPHFDIEHRVRFRRGLFFNFNGTAGIWRRKAIEAAGGWEADTVTEDLDLSYRAQLAGWQFIYLDDLTVPSELPLTMASFRGQQQRWAKGSIQTAKKILPRLLVSPLPLAVKVESLAHLLANFGWLLGAVVTLTLFPTITWRTGVGPYQLMRIDLPLFIGTSFAIFLYFFVYKIRQRGQVPFIRLLLLPVLSIGIAPGIALSVLNGIFSRGGVFERTPKFGIRGRNALPGLAFLYRQRTTRYVLMNVLLFAYSIMPIIFAWQRETWLAVPFLMIFPAGFCFVIFKDLSEMTL